MLFNVLVIRLHSSKDCVCFLKFSLRDLLTSMGKPDERLSDLEVNVNDNVNCFS